jgi:hypothetical protein
MELININRPTDCKIGGPNCTGHAVTTLGKLQIPCCIPCANDAHNRYNIEDGE